MSSTSSQIGAIEARLSSYFDASQPRDKFEDSDINEIARLLALSGNIARECPRVYIVLRTIGHLDQLDRLLSIGFADDLLPIRELRGLPSFLNTEIAVRILRTQKIVETAALQIENGEHLVLGGGPDHPDLFQIGDRLGHGHYGQVDKIMSKVSFKEYALKRIRRRAAFGNHSKLAIKEFRREKEVMKTFNHEHIVRYIGSYTDSRFLGLVMSPVADCDLTVYMRQACTEPSKHPTMQTFFGCLASALCYLHANSIKHRDIKPGNILIHGSKVLITDFGLSRDFLDTTSGLTAHTPRYAPPEVVAHGERNYTGDVWSLGCVFLEIVAALHGHNDAWIRAYFKKHHAKSYQYHENLQAAEQLINEWEHTWDTIESRPLSWIRCMLQAERTSRPSAARVWELTTSEVEPDFSASAFCGICCCSTDDQTDSIDSPVEDSHIERVHQVEIASYASEPRLTSADDQIDLVDSAVEDSHIDRVRQADIANCTNESRPTSERNDTMSIDHNGITLLKEVEHDKIKPEIASAEIITHSRTEILPEVVSSSLFTPGRVFGVPPSTSLQYAYAYIHDFEENPSVNFQEKLPIVLLQCGAYLKGKVDPIRAHNALSSVLHIREDPTFHKLRLSNFIAELNSPPYLIHTSFANGTASTFADTLFAYLSSLPGTLVPRDVSQSIAYEKDSFALIHQKSKWSQIPPHNRTIIIYLVDLFAVCVRRAAEKIKYIFTPSGLYRNVTKAFHSVFFDFGGAEPTLDFGPQILQNLIRHAHEIRNQKSKPVDKKIRIIRPQNEGELDRSHVGNLVQASYIPLPTPVECISISIEDDSASYPKLEGQIPVVVASCGKFFQSSKQLQNVTFRCLFPTMPSYCYRKTKFTFEYKSYEVITHGLSLSIALVSDPKHSLTYSKGEYPEGFEDAKSLLLEFLTSLPEPLLPPNIFDTRTSFIHFVNIIPITMADFHLKKVADIPREGPINNFMLVIFVLRLLETRASHSEESRESAIQELASKFTRIFFDQMERNMFQKILVSRHLIRNAKIIWANEAKRQKR